MPRFSGWQEHGQCHCGPRVKSLSLKQKKKKRQGKYLPREISTFVAQMTRTMSFSKVVGNPGSMRKVRVEDGGGPNLLFLPIGAHVVQPKRLQGF